MTISLAEALTRGEEVPAVSLPLVRYRFEFRVSASVMLPEYAGSTIRGAFGRSLRRTACMTHMSDCKSCPLYRTCPYTMVFETPPPAEHSLQKFSQIPNAYVIEPPHWGRHVYDVGEKLVFHMILFGRARSCLPLVIFALQKAFAYDVGHGRAELLGVYEEAARGGALLYSAGMKEVASHDLCTEVAVPAGNEIGIRLETPLRLQQNGVPLGPERMTAKGFLSALLRRTALVLEFQCGSPLALDFGKLTAASESVDLTMDLGWKDWTRYSSRQNRKMSLGGVVGEMNFRNVPAAFRILLAAGQYVHAGKNATFGLGKLRFIQD